MVFVYGIKHDFIPHYSLSCDTTATTFIWLHDAEQFMPLNITANCISLMGIVLSWWSMLWIVHIPSLQMLQNCIIFCISNKLCSTFLSFYIYWIIYFVKVFLPQKQHWFCSSLCVACCLSCTWLFGISFVSNTLLSYAVIKSIGSFPVVKFLATVAVLVEAMLSVGFLVTFYEQ